MIRYNSIEQIIALAKEQDQTISSLVIEDQARSIGMDQDKLIGKMSKSYDVMRQAVMTGINSNERSTSGLTGGDAKKMIAYAKSGRALSGSVLSKALANALAVAEVNACMGRIVAAPTAGSCGIMPAALLAVQEAEGLSNEDMVKGLFTASAIGMVISTVATVAGAEGGCQAECGSASAMAAAAIVELRGGTPDQIGHACAISLKSIIGLVCDPVAGLVEVPCIKRNAMGIANAISAADMAMAGIESVIPVDEVIQAMKSVGDELPSSLKETAEGGLAATKTAKKLAKALR